MQISLANSPFHPARSDHFFSGWRFPCLFISCILIFVGIGIFCVKNKIYKKISIKKNKYILPLLVFSGALLLNGAFSGKWELADLIFGFAHVAVYLLLFLLMFYGFSDEERAEDLSKYFTYITMLIAIIISTELVHLFLTSNDIFVDGSINKTGVSLGWGIWNLVGVSLAILIPILFYGMEKSKYPWLYFAVATVTYVMSVLTMSRNALIFSSLIYATCIIIFCFVGNNKRVFRIVVALGCLAVIAGVIVLWDKIYSVFLDYFERGLSDNGRFDIWRAAFDNFLDSPVFGGGFYSLVVENFYVFGPLPIMAHNTVFELLSAMGIVGLLAYGYYLYGTARLVFTRPTFLRVMFALSILVLMLESLLDNFVFNLYPIFYYTPVVAIMAKDEEERRLTPKLAIKD